MVQHTFHLFERQIKAGPSIGKAQRAVHITRAVHLDDTQARMLLVIGAKTTIVRAAIDDRRGKCQGDGARLVKLGRRRIGLGITIDQGFKSPMLRTALTHVDLILTEDHLSVYHPAALGTNTAGQFIEDIVSVVLLAHRRDGVEWVYVHATSFATGC